LHDDSRTSFIALNYPSCRLLENLHPLAITFSLRQRPRPGSAIPFDSFGFLIRRKDKSLFYCLQDALIIRILGVSAASSVDVDDLPAHFE
jgi:hypothetical protein